MRYIGNKTKLLDFIRRTLRARGIGPGRAVDPFTGTASVARALKRWGHRVTASDIMDYGHVFARAWVQPVDVPDLRDTVAELNALEPAPGFIHEHYSPAGADGAAHGRMYFTPENAARIDAMRTEIEARRGAGQLSDDGFHVLLAALIEAADRVANTTGVYAAFVKTWQPNALRPLQLRLRPHVRGNGCQARRADAAAVVRDAGEFDLLYLDPPYNVRQYAGYYHIPELIARGWNSGPVELRGKTGLIEDADRRSDWCSSRRCEAVFEELLATARCREIVMSYSAEGIIPEATIERVMKAYGRRATWRRYRRTYRRYRSDADGAGRHYRADSVSEYLYCISR